MCSMHTRTPVAATWAAARWLIQFCARPAEPRALRDNVAACPLQAVQTVEAPTSSGSSAEPAAQQGEDIYIGFAKGDYAPRAGRTGRVIKDDPRKYPAKDDLGFFLGATGGCSNRQLL
jgi:hypothetical protein